MMSKLAMQNLGQLIHRLACRQNIQRDYRLDVAIRQCYN
jgi:hypothetical protein